MIVRIMLKCSVIGKQGASQCCGVSRGRVHVGFIRCKQILQEGITFASASNLPIYTENDECLQDIGGPGTLTE